MATKKWSIILAVLVLLFSSFAFAGTTITYEYDSLNRLKAATYADGSKIEYTYDGAGNRLSQTITGEPQELAMSVGTSTGRMLSGLKVYAFTETGTYTGMYATTDENGTAIFVLEDFSDGNYKFRVDYLGQHFWSDPVAMPDISLVDMVIDEETVVVSVTTGSGSAAGSRVYLFSETGAYLGIYQETDAGGQVSFLLPVGKTFKFRADILGNQYWSDDTTVAEGGVNSVDLAAGGGLFQVTVQETPTDPMEGIKVYLFSESGSYLSLNQVTDSAGRVEFHVPAGIYKVRADHLGYQFWSADTLVAADTDIDLTIAHQDVVVTVSSLYQGDATALEGLKVYLFTPSGTYLNRYQVTDVDGRVTFNLPDMPYKVRADYLNQQFWSEEFSAQDTAVDIPAADADITVTGAGQPLEGITVYVFSVSGTYLNLSDTTDVSGMAIFRLPAGDYKFRADYQGSQYWSDVQTLAADQVNPVAVSTGGGTFALTILTNAIDPLVGATCYLFSESGTYLGLSVTTSSEGLVSFDLADGNYKIRVDLLGYQFWTDVYEVPVVLSDVFTIAHQDVVVTVSSLYQGDATALEGLKVYLFTPSGTYLNRFQVTDADGRVTFSLPQVPYKVRADYRNQQFWSEEFTGQDTVVEIPAADAEIIVTDAGQPLEGITVYVFSATGTYLNLSGTTDVDGIVLFRLPAGDYKFRADYQGSQYWSDEQTLVADQVNSIEISTGGGTFALTVLTNATDSLVGATCYLFSASGTYLGLSATTSSEGQVSFDLADGNYKIRVDHIGYQFWTDVYEVPVVLSDVFTIDHQDVTVTVNQVYGTDVTPLESIRVYLFKGTGSYMGVYADTDAQGLVSFNLPQEEYKVRADYMGAQYWSDTLIWSDQYVDIDHGFADLHITFNGADVDDAPIYLFSESGSCLGKFERTDASGYAGFLIPSDAYKFRVDYNGTQYWSEVVNVTPHEETDVEFPLE